MKSFQDKTVLVTGASSGFGRAIAKLFAREGARLINIARRKERLDELERELRSSFSTDVLSIELDVADLTAVKTKLHALQHVPDILVNNAGVAKELNKVWETSPEAWNEMIDTNIKGILNVSSQIIPQMLEKKRGDIINIGSISGYDTYPGGGVYCSTKWALKALSDTLRKELVDTPLRVSLIAPGLANTEFSQVRFSGDKTKADATYKGIEPLKAEDVAEAVLFAASRPPHVQVGDLVLFPTHQASVSIIHRNK